MIHSRILNLKANLRNKKRITVMTPKTQKKPVLKEAHSKMMRNLQPKVRLKKIKNPQERRR